MDAVTRASRQPSWPRIELIQSTNRHPWLGMALIALGAGLIANSLLGPLVADAIDYPFSASMLNQTIGLEAVSLLVVAPLCIFAGCWPSAGILPHRSSRSGRPHTRHTCSCNTSSVRSIATTPGVLPLHLALFVLGAAIGVAAWAGADTGRLPQMARRSDRRYAVLLLALAAFIVSRYLPALFAGLEGDPLPAEFREDVTMYWSILLLDLGIVVPATAAAAVALIRGTGWRSKALYAVLGWFALVPPSVAAMAIVMVVKDDLNASIGQAIVLTFVAIVFGALAVPPYRLLFGRHEEGSKAAACRADPMG